jgi:Trk K+ transport system NAD-binding subunit
MKSLPLVLSTISAPLRQRNVRLLLALIGVFTVLVVVFSTLFHVLMEREGQSHSWATGVYWTLVTMTTLGFGDITFQSDAGRVFSVVVLLSGTVFLLVLLPFTFIQFVFLPWMSLREASRAPRQVPPDMSGHLVLTGLGPIEDGLVRRADQVGAPYVLLAGDREEALRLHDRGYHVMVGDLDDPEAYRMARVDAAALVAATQSDTTNTNIAFTVRELSRRVPIVATASSPASIDILELAGADAVLELGQLLGAAMAERGLGPDGRTHVIGNFAGIQIAEARIAGTPLAGRTLGEVRLRARLGVGIVGVWRRGAFEVATADTKLEPTTVLLMAGSPDQLAAYDACYGVQSENPTAAVIIGGGRVGRAAGHAFERAGVPYLIVEQRSERIRDPDRYVLGDAAELAVLKRAGIDAAGTVVVTTHDDDMNVYLTIYCRRLRPDVTIVGRANLDRNVTTLYRAGADSVLSYASTGATAIWNHLRENDTLLVAEGLNVFRRPIPAALAGRTLTDAHIRRHTGCNVVAVEIDGTMRGNPDATQTLPSHGNLVLVGDLHGEALYDERYHSSRHGRRRRRRELGAT